MTGQDLVEQMLRNILDAGLEDVETIEDAKARLTLIADTAADALDVVAGWRTPSIRITMSGATPENQRMITEHITKGLNDGMRGIA